MEHEPESTDLVMMPMIMSNGRGGTTTTMMPYWIHDDEDWVVVIENADDSGKLVRRTLYVTEDTFAELEPGYWFTVDGATCEDRDPDTKTRKRD